MPVVRVYRHGGKAGIAPGRVDPLRPKRGQIEGWSKSAARRNTEFLWSVDIGTLTGRGVAFTLTLRTCPETPDDWHRIRRAFIERLRRRGFTRLHWVTEWQRRGVPHLHGVVWFDDLWDMAAILNAWLDVSEPYGSTMRGQNAKPINNALGWLQYLAKHASRGVSHYQRNALNMPPEWQGRTGRVWGHLGNWVTTEPRKFATDEEGFYRLRRMVRSWRVADARQGDYYERKRRVPLARHMLTCNDETRSRLRGYSEWMPEEGVQLRMLMFLAAAGCPLVDLATGEMLQYVKGSMDDNATIGSGRDSRSPGKRSHVTTVHAP